MKNLHYSCDRNHAHAYTERGFAGVKGRDVHAVCKKARDMAGEVGIYNYTHFDAVTTLLAVGVCVFIFYIVWGLFCVK